MNNFEIIELAVSNAKILQNIEPNDLFYFKITVDEGPVLKRILPKSRGRGEIIKKRMSHINLVLDIKNKKWVTKSIPKFLVKGIEDWLSQGFYGKNL